MTFSHVYRTSRFESSLEDLRRQGGRALLIAEKTEQIVGGLLRGGDIFKLCRRTGRGEYRIDRCFKFDLGGGYRAVCLIHGTYLVLLYVGTHDDCGRWIERNRGIKYDIGEAGLAVPVTKTSAGEWTTPPEVEEEHRFSEEYEDSIAGNLDDDLLRKIFVGLARNS